MELYKSIAEHVIKTFLTEDKKGEYIALVIDDLFMKDLAFKLGTSIDELIRELRYQLYYNCYGIDKDLDFALAAISLQLYAASKCETDRDEKYSARAYNPKLKEILNFNDNELYEWYEMFQKRVWEIFYKWCNSNSFIVQKPQYSRNKYVQYPLELAKYTLNREDLKYIASIFHRYKIQPNEDIYYCNFWKILDVRFDFNHLNKRIQRVFNAVYADTKNHDIVKSQIYNYFLEWDGEYIDSYKQNVQNIISNDSYKLHLLNKDNCFWIDVRKEDGSKVARIQVDNNLEESLKDNYSFRREGIIIFQRCEYGDSNYWDETRFVESKEDIGVAIVFKTTQRNVFLNSKSIFYSKDIIIYEFRYDHLTKDFYSTEDKPYRLIGGLKIARNTYLTGGEPILSIQRKELYLIDGKAAIGIKGEYNLDLPVGEHIIKFPKCKEIKITIVNPIGKTAEWAEKYNKWVIDRKSKYWSPSSIEKGIIGLNFDTYSSSNDTYPTLQAWVKLHKGEEIRQRNNIALKQLNNINKNE